MTAATLVRGGGQISKPAWGSLRPACIPMLQTTILPSSHRRAPLPCAIVVVMPRRRRSSARLADRIPAAVRSELRRRETRGGPVAAVERGQERADAQGHAARPAAAWERHVVVGDDHAR
jgi:hypothetical protein